MIKPRWKVNKLAYGRLWMQRYRKKQRMRGGERRILGIAVNWKWLSR